MKGKAASAAGISLLLFLTACGPGDPDEDTVSPEIGKYAAKINRIAESYVKLVLAVGRHDEDYVDAYYGPREWKEEADKADLPLPEIKTRAAALVGELGEGLPPDSDGMTRMRHNYLTRQLEALLTRVDMLRGKRLTFDEESEALYDAVAPVNSEEHFQAVLDRLEVLLPGEGSLLERYETFRKEFVIPEDRLDSVLRAAISACRERTVRYIELPPEESFEVEYVTGKAWSAYNWYQGNFHSLIQVNTSLPIYIDRAIDLACHEGYPGHHVYNVLLEGNLVRGRGWMEFSVYPLFSPQSLIAEGSANFGVRIAFPGSERADFERRSLFPLAGLDPERAERYSNVRNLLDKLSYAGNEAARRYLDGRIDAAAAAAWLARYGLYSKPRAEQRVRFIDKYRSYVINYNLGQDMVKRYVESKAGAEASPEKTWRIFRELLESPRLPSDLR